MDNEYTPPIEVAVALNKLSMMIHDLEQRKSGALEVALCMSGLALDGNWEWTGQKFVRTQEVTCMNS